ncbi:MAG: hypothetical protein EKK48_13330 [Candidatus Melainabacteria bacterium]|nr:MAG: hypothetical protein EKK48_13330 [Candidatus Melainabacteria bacterium]
MSIKTRIIVAAALVLSTVSVPVMQPVRAEHTAVGKAHKNGVHEEVLIKAPPKIVWRSMLEQRKIDPDSAYIKSASENGEPVVEQKFIFPSPFGNAECILHLNETAAQRVDFKLISSEDLKAMEGSWILTPTEEGHTKLSLSTYVEPNISLPRMITNGIVSHRSKRNLSMVKKLAESSAKSM